MTGQSLCDSQAAEELRGFDDFELRLGDVMRGERATLGKSLIDIQRELKIKATYIAAIENADASAFDTPGFIAGYVRSYARYLGLDPEWAWEAFCRESGFEQPHGLSAGAAPKRPVRKTGLDALGDPNATFAPRRESPLAQIELRALGSLAVVLALITGVGYGAWSVFQEIQRVELAPIDRAPGVVAELGAAPVGPAPVLEGAAFEAPQTLASSGEGLDRLYRAPALDVPVMVARDGPIAAVDPETVGVMAEEMAALTPLPGMPRPVPRDGGQEPQVLAEAEPDVVLLAVRPAWVRVTASDGTVLLEKILDAGERWTVPAMEDPPQLRAGNSGAVYFAIGDQTYGPVAPGPSVVREVALDASALAETYALAEPGADPDLAAIAVAAAGEGQVAE